jgi:hypothetical protein
MSDPIRLDKLWFYGEPTVRVSSHVLIQSLVGGIASHTSARAHTSFDDLVT